MKKMTTLTIDDSEKNNPLFESMLENGNRIGSLLVKITKQLKNLNFCHDPEELMGHQRS